MSDGSLEFQNLPLYTSLCFKKYIRECLYQKIFRLIPFIFVIILLVLNEVDLDVAFVHPFQEFLIKVVTASGKFILDIN